MFYNRYFKSIISKKQNDTCEYTKGSHYTFFFFLRTHYTISNILTFTYKELTKMVRDLTLKQVVKGSIFDSSV